MHRDGMEIFEISIQIVDRLHGAVYGLPNPVVEVPMLFTHLLRVHELHLFVPVLHDLGGW